MRRDNWPTPQELAEAPELAVIAGLYLGMDLVVLALTAAYPEIGDDDFPRGACAPARIADQIMQKRSISASTRGAKSCWAG